MDIATLKDYLHTLGYLRLYFIYLKNTGKQDNLTNIKLYYNNNIFISIIDFRDKNYDKLFFDKVSFKKYMKLNPSKSINKNDVKRDKKYRIFLR
jgi:hypothetical protein